MFQCPGPQIYLSTLEVSKSFSGSLLARFDLPDTAALGAASFVGGAMASLSSQLIVVPIDVVAQRLMLLGGGASGGGASGASGGPAGRAAAATEAAARRRTTGLHLARQIVRQEGLRGLYRGFGASLAMFVPNSAIWWAGCCCGLALGRLAGGAAGFTLAAHSWPGSTGCACCHAWPALCLPAG